MVYCEEERQKPHSKHLTDAHLFEILMYDIRHLISWFRADSAIVNKANCNSSEYTMIKGSGYVFVVINKAVCFVFHVSI